MSGFTVSGNSLTLTGGINNNIAAGTSAWSIGTSLTASQTFTCLNSGALLQLGNVSIGAGKTLTIAGAGDTTISGILGGGSGNIIKNGAGTLTLSAANSFGGSTIINAGTVNASDNGTLGYTSGITINVGGTLLLSSPAATDRINDGAAVNLAGGSLVIAGGASEGYAGSDASGSDAAPGMGALTLSADSRIDFGTGGVGDVVFDTYAVTGDFKLSIDNWVGAKRTLGISGVTDRLVFQNDPSGSIGSISFNLETGATPAMVVPYGSLFEVVPVGPVPEPATAFAGLALIGFIGWRERRRLVPGCSRPGVREINEKDGASHFEPDKSTISLKNYSTGSFDRGAAGWKEALWFVVKCLFFLNPLPWPSALRVALLRAFGAEIGRGVVVRANAHITFPWRLTVGDDVWIGEEVFILSLAPVVIGSNVSISQRAFLCTGSHNFRAHGFDLVTKPINVAHGSWIAAQAFIGPGVSIGQGSMICAGSVVTGNVPPRTMARGNPAVLTAVDQNGEQPCVSSF